MARRSKKASKGDKKLDTKTWEKEIPCALGKKTLCNSEKDAGANAGATGNANGT
jgi:hypothetical protein